MGIYRSKYVNEFGDQWFLEVDQEQGVALLRGTDIDENLRVPIVDYCGPELALNAAEQEWLQDAWRDGTQDAPAFELYRGLDCSFVAGSRSCYLTNDYCPLCLIARHEFENHHCIWSADGGMSDAHNLLSICKSCHALLTYGCSEDRVPRDLAAYYHQFMHFGLDFIPRQSPSSGRHQDRRYLDSRPGLREFLSVYTSSTSSVKKRCVGAIRYLARVYYQYYRDVAREVSSFVDHYKYQIALCESTEGRFGEDQPRGLVGLSPPWLMTAFFEGRDDPRFDPTASSALRFPS